MIVCGVAQVSPGFYTLLRLGHVGGVLGIGTSELVADIVHDVAADKQRPRRIVHAYILCAEDEIDIVVNCETAQRSRATAFAY